MLIHIVLFKLKNPTAANRSALTGRLRALGGAIPFLRKIEVGEDVSHSDRSFDVALITRFDDLDGLALYQQHPRHQEVLAWIAEMVSETRTVDFFDG